MIRFVEKDNTFLISTENTSYAVCLVDGKFVAHGYYGPRISDSALLYLTRVGAGIPDPEETPEEKSGFMDSCPMEYSAGGTGDLRETCIITKNEKGQRGCELHYVSHTIRKGIKEGIEGVSDDKSYFPASFGDDCEELTIITRDEILGLEVRLVYTVFPDSDVIIRSARIKNEGGALYLERALSAALDIDDRKYETVSFYGDWAREHELSFSPLGYGAFVTESRRGEPGHQGQPFLGIASKGITENSGEIFGMHLIYSGNYIGKVEKNGFGTLHAVMGIQPEGFSWKLEHGEEFFTPECVLIYSGSGYGAMSRGLHDFYRKHLIRSKWQFKERPILVNNWEATYFDFNGQKLLEIAREAKKLGIEMLVVDDGWFGHHRDKPSGDLGDWFANEKKLQGSLRDLSAELKKMGMKTGLWFEPEMISEDSDLFRSHPDWVLSLDGRIPVRCRDQWVLDLSNPAVREYLIESIEKVLRSADISYIKWDMNRPITDAGSGYLPADRQGEIAHRHVLGLYEIQNRILQDFPDILLENCSAGGARFDPGMLYMSPQIWCSDDMDPIERLTIEEGTEFLYPLSTMGAHVAKVPNDVTGRSVPFTTRAVMAMTGTFGYELDITKLPEEEKRQIPNQIRVYKMIRPLVQKGDYFRLESFRENGRFDTVEVLSADKTEGVIYALQGLSRANDRSRMLRLKGLDPDAVYEITVLLDSELEGDYRRGDFHLNDSKKAVLYGDTLMHAGLCLPWIKSDFAAKLYLIRKI